MLVRYILFIRRLTQSKWNPFYLDLKLKYNVKIVEKIQFVSTAESEDVCLLKLLWLSDSSTRPFYLRGSGYPHQVVNVNI